MSESTSPRKPNPPSAQEIEALLDRVKAEAVATPAARPSNPAPLVFVVAVLSFIMIAWVPRKVAPTDVPGLEFDKSKAEAQFEADAEAAKKIPAGEEAKQVQALYAAAQRAAVSGGFAPAESNVQHDLRILALRKLRDRHGPSVSDAFRAAVAAKTIPAITGQLPREEMEATIGPLIGHMLSHGMAQGSHITAPSVVIRTAAKAQWNQVFERPVTEGFSDFEREMHFGWLALQGAGASAADRLVALEAYEKAGGKKMDEARATLLFFSGEGLASSKLWEALYKERGNLRFRNHALAALALATQ
ncbi:MAG: hypothetical protein R3A78_04280 [Polyangiales bacterium]|nr:hypothetical protein [Myxococcales bacterium]